MLQESWDILLITRPFLDDFISTIQQCSAYVPIPHSTINADVEPTHDEWLACLPQKTQKGHCFATDEKNSSLLSAQKQCPIRK